MVPRYWEYRDNGEASLYRDRRPSTPSTSDRMWLCENPLGEAGNADQSHSRTMKQQNRRRNNRTEQLADLKAPLRHRNPEPYTMPCAAREQCTCLIQARTPQAPDGHLCRCVCGGRLHGLCAEVEGPDSDEPMHRICRTCAITKATATGAG